MKQHIEQHIEEIVSESLNHAEHTLSGIAGETDRMVEPYRRSMLRRFPVLFSLLVAFGISATYFGFERIIVAIPWLGERPLLILGIGLATLALTGTLYKKLG